MGAAGSSAALALGHTALEAKEVEALERRYGGWGGDDRLRFESDGDDPQEREEAAVIDDYDPCKPEYIIPPDDYDPRKPEYIVQASQDHEEKAVVQLRQQMERLKAALSKRRLDPASPVVAHYRSVLNEMERTVDAAMRRRSNSGTSQDGSFLSACSRYLAGVLAEVGAEVRSILVKQPLALVGGSSSAPPRPLCLKATFPHPNVHFVPMREPAGDDGLVEFSSPSSNKASEVQCRWVQSSPAVYHRRTLETKVMPGKLVASIWHPPVNVEASAGSAGASRCEFAWRPPVNTEAGTGSADSSRCNFAWRPPVNAEARAGSFRCEVASMPRSPLL